MKVIISTKVKRYTYLLTAHHVLAFIEPIRIDLIGSIIDFSYLIIGVNHIKLYKCPLLSGNNIIKLSLGFDK